MPTVEGLTPNVLWTTLYGIIGICLLFMVVYKVYDAIHTIMERRRKQKESEKPDFAEAVSQKVIDKLEPRFEEIEHNLAEDKRRLDSHESLIKGVQDSHKEVHDGLVAICEYMMAMAQYGNIGGDSAEMKKATAKMTQYLTNKIC